MFSSYKCKQMSSASPLTDAMLFDDTSCTIPNGALTGRQCFDLYCRGDNLPVCPDTPKYDQGFRVVHTPSDINEALSLAHSELSQMALPDSSSAPAASSASPSLSADSPSES